MKVIISAGGTGGHIYPALAIANKIKERNKDAEILYIGTKNRMEKDIGLMLFYGHLHFVPAFVFIIRALSRRAG